ncbi:MAG: cation transporter [Pseudomonadota bacterium]
MSEDYDGSVTIVTDAGFRRTVIIVALLNLAYFGIEFAVALAIGSVSLFADSVDFLEDAAVNLLIATALAWSSRRRANVGKVLAALLLVPALALLWALWTKYSAPLPPSALPLGATGLGALAVNLTCAFLLVRFRHHGGSLSRAAFLSARNDALANVAIIAAGALTALHPSIWPDVVVGVGIAALNVDAAREVWQAAQSERDAAA